MCVCVCVSLSLCVCVCVCECVCVCCARPFLGSTGILACSVMVWGSIAHVRACSQRCTMSDDAHHHEVTMDKLRMVVCERVCVFVCVCVTGSSDHRGSVVCQGTGIPHGE